VSTIKSTREIDEIFRESRRVGGAIVTALIKDTPEGRGRSGRVAFVAGKRIGNAVFRNRAKRVMRAAVSRCGAPWPGYDVVLIASKATGAAASAELDRALQRISARLGNES